MRYCDIIVYQQKMSVYKHNIILQRYLSNSEGTLGTLKISDGTFLCYVLEDPYRPVKIKHKTRISAGTYNLTRRMYGGFYERYRKKFEGHDWMWELKNVPLFTNILIHCGNTVEDTSGCLLLGSYPSAGVKINRSVDAYKKVYPIFNNLFKVNGDELSIIIQD